jgi:hypothetical protein
MKTQGKTLIRQTCIAALALAPTVAMARGFTCSPRNDVCVVNDKSIVSGDELGFFTDRGELIATGKVTKMNGSRRSVQLQQVMGQVDAQAESYVMLDGRSSTLQRYRTYRRPAKLLIGSSMGLTTFGAGADSSGYEISGQAIRSRFLGKVDAYARGSIYTISGTSRQVFGDGDVGEFKANALAGTAGLSYNLFSRDNIVLRTEAGVGLAYMMASINGSTSAAKSADWGYEVNSGFGLHGRGLLALGYKLDTIQIEAGFAPAVLAGRSATTIGLGFLMNFE